MVVSTKPAVWPANVYLITSTCRLKFILEECIWVGRRKKDPNKTKSSFILKGLKFYQRCSIHLPYFCTRYCIRVNCVTVDLDIRVCRWGLLVVSRWRWVAESYGPFPCRVGGAKYPVVVVLLGFVRVQEGVSRQLIPFVICGPAETRLLHTEWQRAGRHWDSIFVAILEVLVL